MHKFTPVAVLLFVVYSISLFAQGSDTKVEASQKGPKRFVVDKAHTDIGFLVRHMVLSKVRGEFKDYTIDLTWDVVNPENSSVEVRIQVASINTDNQRRDSHLKSSDFFDAKNYPEIIFNSTKIEKVDDKEYVAHGSLTIRGVTKEIELPFEYLGKLVQPDGKVRIGIEAELELNRFDYGLKWNKTLETGGLVVGEEVNVGIQTELVSAM